MRRKLMMTFVIALLMVPLGAVPALGWANGADLDGDGQGDDGYGTHDWVLSQAFRLAGSRASWVDQKVALLASDDPDSIFKDFHNHQYMNTNKAQGAPQTVADCYWRMTEAYAAGDYRRASYELGLLSHYYSDISQPYHTWWDPTDSSAHLRYELTVDKYHRKPSDNQSWITANPRKPVSDVRAMTISAALAARADYKPLKSAYVPGKSNAAPEGNFSAAANTVTGGITRARLSRTANDLADIIASVPSGSGKTASATVTRLSTFRRYVGRDSNVAAYATVRGPKGEPLQGVRVTYDWQFKDGPRQDVAYTDSLGNATLYHGMGGAPLWHKVDLTASVTTNGWTSSLNEWVMPSPLIGEIKTAMSTHAPQRGSRVTATTTIRDANNKPIKGLEVVFHWRYNHKTAYTYAVSDENGVATSSRNIGASHRGQRIYVRAQTQSANTNRSSTSSFVPK